MKWGALGEVWAIVKFSQLIRFNPEGLRMNWYNTDSYMEQRYSGISFKMNLKKKTKTRREYERALILESAVFVGPSQFVWGEIISLFSCLFLHTDLLQGSTCYGYPVRVQVQNQGGVTWIMCISSINSSSWQCARNTFCTVSPCEPISIHFQLGLLWGLLAHFSLAKNMATIS